jgi:hypothetical protein
MYYFSIFIAVLLVPMLTAHGATQPTDFKSLMGSMTDIVNLIIPLIFGLTFLTIAWGTMKAWIMGEATQEDIDRGKKIVLIGVIVLTIMSAIWGILVLLRSSLFG